MHHQNQDLPTELWIKILSYLPPCTLTTKLLGIGSRYLFEAAMNKLYEVVRMRNFTDLKRLEQLKYESVARRVRKVYVCTESFQFLVEDVEGKKNNLKWGVFKRRKARKAKRLLGSAASQDFGFGFGRDLNDEDYRSMPEFLLSLAIQRLGACPNIQEITIEAIRSNEPITPTYAHFLHSLLLNHHNNSPKSQPIKIHILNIDVDINNWRNKSDSYHPFSILPIRFGALKNLTQLNVSLESSVELSVGGEYMSCVEQLREVVLEARDSLQSVVVRTSSRRTRDLPCDVAEIFPTTSNVVVTFPVLKRLEIRSEVYGMNIVRSAAVAKFLTRSAPNLESLTLFGGKGYGRGQESIIDQARRRRLGDILNEIKISGIRLSELKELVISLSAVEVGSLVNVFEAGLMPGLRKLVLAPLEGFAFSFEVFRLVLEGIVNGAEGGANVLEEVEVYVRSLSPSHLVVLQSWFPRLKKVYFVYGYLSVVPDAREEENADTIYAAFQMSAHLDWRSRVVRFEEMEFDPRFEGNPHEEVQRRIQQVN